jgi:hypothetical protein
METNYVTDEVRSLIGAETEFSEAPHPVEASEVRRFHQATLDESPRYWDASASRYGGPVAPLGFPVHAFRRAPGTPDPLDSMDDPDFDGVQRELRPGLPAILLPFKRLLNGGYRYRFFRYAAIGDRILVRSRYKDIYQRQGKTGPMVFVLIEDEYVTHDRKPLLTTVNTMIMR